MSSVINSAAAFTSFLKEIGLASLLPAFEEQCWETYGDLGFACASPGDPASIKSEIIDKLLGSSPAGETPDPALVAAYKAKEKLIPRIRRAFATAYSIAQADAEKFAAQDQDPVIRLHPAEREVRRQKLQQSISGFSMSGELDPSSRLVDLMATILQSGQVRYVPWQKCTTARSELLDKKETPGLKLGANGCLVPAELPEGPNCDLSSDLALDNALRRRSLAAEIAGLCEYQAMQLWHECLKEAIYSEPIPGYGRVSHAQLARADRELWTLIAASCRNGCKGELPEGPTAFQDALKEHMFSLRIRLLLSPLPSSSARGSSLAPPPLLHLARLELKTSCCRRWKL